MTRCPHEGPHYCANEKGVPGVWLCKDCIAQTEMEPGAHLPMKKVWRPRLERIAPRLSMCLPISGDCVVGVATSEHAPAHGIVLLPIEARRLRDWLSKAIEWMEAQPK